MIRRFSLRELLRVLCVVLFFGLAGMTGLVHAQPNIIHFFIDDFGWTDASAPELNGGNQSLFHQTPTIEQLASQGMAFTSAYATQTCTSSRASLMTGQYGPRTGVYSVAGIDNQPTSPLLPPGNLEILQNTTDTVAERLQAAGYVTGHFGKFDATQGTAAINTRHGFDFNFGGTRQNAPQTYFPTQNATTGNWEFDPNVSPTLDPYAAPYTQSYIDDNLAPYANGANVNSLVGTAKHLTDATTDAAVDFIANRTSNGDTFYMNMAYHAIHSPFEGRPDLQTKYQGIIAANGGSSPDPNHDNTQIAALVEGMDQGIARILASLDDPNGDGSTADSVLANTMIVFSGDNGNLAQSSSAPLTGAKGAQTEGGLRVPTLFYQPGVIAPGTSDIPVHVVDFYPTFVDAGGGTLPNATTQPVDGESLMPLLTGTATELDRGVFFHYPGYANNASNIPKSTVVKRLAGGTKNVKLQYDIETRTYAQYNLTADISESTDLADLAPTVGDFRDGARLAAELATWLADTGADMPTLRADGTPVPLPSHTPQFQYSLNSTSQPTMDGQANATVTELGVALTLNAVGSGAVLDLNANGIGINSTLDSGGAGQERRIDGTLATPEALEISFDQDVMLKSLNLRALSTTGAETFTLDFVSGDNPFTGLNGYATSDFVVGPTGLTFTQTAGTDPVTLDFGVLAMDEILLTADTVLAISTSTTDAGGILLSNINVARPLSDLNLILADVDLDGDFSCSDLNAFSMAASAGTNDPDFDLTGDGLVNTDDLTEWRTIAGAAELAAGTPYPMGDVDLDGDVTSADLGLLLNNFTDTNSLGWCSGNLDADTSVDSTDLGLLLNNFGYDSVAAAAAVPEPELHWMLLFAPLLMLRRKSRKSA